MAAYGVPNVHRLAVASGVPNSVIYQFLSGRTATLGIVTRRKLAAVFTGSERLFAADILGFTNNEAPDSLAPGLPGVARRPLPTTTLTGDTLDERIA
jgi:hypothetical protein